ncbi:ABC transporter permease [Pedobacter antarcticus 4BY]|uniref:ABC transporter permease n=2 Tax=Pedobacter antarcticus TaxID=34086 RepID=A0A081PIY2_9SPHI|nr:ABC transporter permease [Pedobacter antarcticus]KEQ30655.1 ABC transporter permease [Pedobacter antarcticus 4BY]SFF19968.1 duplicated orphan permease [Pedobacter antarcticus]
MFRLNLKIALRNLWKNKGYTFINIAGLSVGMAGCILIYIFISYQLSFDQQYTNKDRIYRVVSYWKYSDGEEFQNGVPKPLAYAMRNDFSQLEEVAPLQRGGGVIQVMDEAGRVKMKTDETVFYTDLSFFKIFNYKWLAGTPEQSVTEPNTVAISRKTAIRYFGNWQQAIGKTIVFKQVNQLKVSGVFEDQPETSSNPVQIVLAYSGYKHRQLKEWGSVSSGSECYVLLKDGVKPADLSGTMQAFIKKYYSADSDVKESHFFQSLSDIHVDERYGNFAGKNTSMRDIYGLAAIGLLLLLTACINFINLATAQAIGRSKEVGIRKVIGGNRRELLTQFFTETITLSFFALLLACVITEAALPALSGLFEDQLSFSPVNQPALIGFMLLLVLFVGLLAGVYPAVVLSGFNPVLALKNKVNVGNSGGGSLRKVLVVVQFAITVVLIAGTLIILQQMKYMREKPLGFNSSAIAMAYLPNDSLSVSKFEIIKARVAALPGVSAVSLCSFGPSSSDNKTSNFSYNSSRDMDFMVNTKAGDEDYFKTFGLSVLAGRSLSKSDTLKELVINETLMRKLNIVKPEDAIGQHITLMGKKVPIVGVVKDFINKSLKEGISPIVLYNAKNSMSELAVKMDTRQISTLMLQIEAIWNSYYPNYVYSSSFLDDHIRAYYESEVIMGTLLKIFAGVIIFIAFMGLFGLISFVATQKTKELAIRKVLGATTVELVSMLNSSFIKLILLANLVAWPITYMLVSRWLSGYAYRIDLNIWPFMVAMIISLLITVLTVSLRTYQAAMANPVNALKNE